MNGRHHNEILKTHINCLDLLLQMILYALDLVLYRFMLESHLGTNEVKGGIVVVKGATLIVVYFSLTEFLL